jgi:hypothetical protein
MAWWNNIRNPFGKAADGNDGSLAPATIDDKRKIISNLPNGRVSVPNVDYSQHIGALKDNMRFIQPGFIRELIPLIRGLSRGNNDVSQAIHNIVNLCNTEHSISFDASVSPEEADRMIEHLERVRENWVAGADGIEAITNKMISQMMIGGALSNEWVPKEDLSGIHRIVFVNPEEIEWALDNRSEWHPYQIIKGLLFNEGRPVEQRVKLNPNTYKYFAINGDEDIPYGYPPYLSVLDLLARKKHMNMNIDSVMELMGLLGFLEVTVEKPDQKNGEADEAYKSRIENQLLEVKSAVQQTFKEGVVTGHEGDHKFEFHSSARQASGIEAIVQNTDYNIGSALKQDLSLLGRSYGSTETMITVLFSKVLAELSNLQRTIAKNYQFGYDLELRLAGFTKFKKVRVQFKRSTPSDELKHHQAEEIKIRNLRALYVQGILSQDGIAHRMGVDKPDRKEPREIEDPAIGAEKKQKREKDKDKSDRKGTEKKQERPKS